MKETINPNTPVDKLDLEAGTQMRAFFRDDVIADYQAAMERGDKLPPVIVFFDPKLKKRYIGDGFHRVKAAINLGRKVIPAKVRVGTLRDAILFAAGSNETHGLRRSVEDRRRSVQALLSDEEWVKKSDLWIAEKARVSCDLVARVRESMTPKDQQPQTREDRTGRQQPARKSRRAAKPDREPGDDTATERPKHEKNGDVVGFAWPTFDAIYGQLMRQFDIALKPFKAHNTAEANALRQALKDIKFRLRGLIKAHKEAKPEPAAKEE